MDFRTTDLDRAVEAGVLDAATRDRLAGFLLLGTAATGASSGPDAENFRLLTGFNDIFVALAILLLLLPMGYLFRPWGPLVGLVLAFGLSEHFIRRRRMALPAIILLGAVCLLAFQSVVELLKLLPVYQDSVIVERLRLESPPELRGQPPIYYTHREEPLLPAVMAVAAACALAAAALHWRRYRVPVTVAAGCGALVAVIGFTLSFAGVDGRVWFAALLASGVAVFALAMRYDMKDRTRTSRFSDIAFWLHLLAAPLIVHPLFQLLGAGAAQPSPLAAPAVLVLFLLLVLLSLVIDRRAFLVAALIYVLAALASLFGSNQIANVSILTALLLGGFLVSLSAAWGRLRRILLPRLPSAIRARVPEPEPG